MTHRRDGLIPARKADIEWEPPQLVAACTLNAAREGNGHDAFRLRARRQTQARTAAAVGQRGTTRPALGGIPTRRPSGADPDRSRSAVHAATAGRPALCERGRSRPTLARAAPGRRGGLKARLPGAGQLPLPVGSVLCTGVRQHAQTMPTPTSSPIANVRPAAPVTRIAPRESSAGDAGDEAEVRDESVVGAQHGRARSRRRSSPASGCVSYMRRSSCSRAAAVGRPAVPSSQGWEPDATLPRGRRHQGETAARRGERRSGAGEPGETSQACITTPKSVA